MPASDISDRAHLRSAERRDMLVPRTRTELGRQSFSVAAPTVWNCLQMPTSDPLENIRYKSVMYLLTYLFRCMTK